MDYDEIEYWNYRLVKKVIAEEDQIGIHEVYYNKNDVPVSCTVNPVKAVGDNVEDAQHVVELMLRACNKPILDYNIFERAGTRDDTGE